MKAETRLSLMASYLQPFNPTYHTLLPPKKKQFENRGEMADAPEIPSRTFDFGLRCNVGADTADDMR